MDALVAIVPVKPFAEAKTRLASVLDEQERSALARRLLERTLLKLTRAKGIARVVVISRDEAVLKIGRKYGAWSIGESAASPETPTLNAALEQARRVSIANGARAVLVIPTDLPRLRVRDLDKIIALGESSPQIVIVPATRDGGTNALLLNPVDAIDFQFGDASFQKHVTAANERNIPVALYTSDTVTLDLDLPEDLDRSLHSHF